MADNDQAVNIEVQMQAAEAIGQANALFNALRDVNSQAKGADASFQEASSSIANAGDAAASASAQMNQTAAQTNNAASAAQNLAVSTDQASSKANELRSFCSALTGKLFESVGGWGAVKKAIDEAVNATIEFIQDSVELAAKLETLELHLKYMSEGASNVSEIMDSLKEASRQTGFSVGELGNAAQVAVRAGADAQGSMRRITDLANATGQSLEKTAGAYARALSGNSRALMALSRSYGISTNDLLLHGANMEENGKIATKTADDLDALKKALDILIDSKYAGATADALNTLEGTQRALEASIDRTKSAIGNELLPLWKEFYDVIYNTLRAQEEFFSLLRKRMYDQQEVFKINNAADLFGYDENYWDNLFLSAEEIAEKKKQALGLETTYTGLFTRLERVSSGLNIDISAASEADIKRLQQANISYESLTYTVSQLKDALEAAKKAGKIEVASKIEEQIEAVGKLQKSYEQLSKAEQDRRRNAQKVADAEAKRLKEEERAAIAAAKAKEQAATEEAQRQIEKVEERQKANIEMGMPSLDAVREALAEYEKILTTNGQIKDSLKAQKLILDAIKKKQKEEGKEERASAVQQASDSIKAIEEARQEAVENRNKSELQAVNEAIAAYKELLASDEELANNAKARQKIEAQITLDIKSRRKLERQETVLAAEEKIREIEQDRTAAVRDRAKSEIDALDAALKRYREILRTDERIKGNADARRKIEKQISALVDERKQKEEAIIAMQRQASSSLIQAQRTYEQERNKTIDKELKLLAKKEGSTETATYRQKEQAVQTERLENIASAKKRAKETIEAQESARRTAEKLYPGRPGYEKALREERERIRESDEYFLQNELNMLQEAQAKTRYKSQQWTGYQTQIQDIKDKFYKIELERINDEFEAALEGAFGSKYNVDKASRMYKDIAATFEQKRKAAAERLKQSGLDVQYEEETRKEAETKAVKAGSSMGSAVVDVSDSLEKFGSDISECSITLDSMKKLDLTGVVKAFSMLTHYANEAAQALAEIPNTIQVIVNNNIQIKSQKGEIASADQQTSMANVVNEVVAQG